MMVLGRNSLLIVTVLLISAFGAIAATTQVETVIKYLAKDAIYIDAGRSSGIELGDTCVVQNEESTVLVVVYVSEKSASCVLKGEAQPLAVGMKVVVRVTVDDEAELPILKAETDTLPEERSRKSLEPSNPRAANLRGRISTSLTWQEDLSGEAADIIEPELKIRGTVERFMNSDWRLRVNARLREIRREQTGSPTEQSWNNRIYEVSLQKHSDDSPWRYGMGRIRSSSIRGMGAYDGLFVEYGEKSGYSYGLFAGMGMDGSTSRPDTDKTKAGLFIGSSRSFGDNIEASGTLALAGRYTSSTIDREYLYEQLSIRAGRLWSVYESAELSLNRGWRSDSIGSPISFSNFVTTLRYTPARGMSFYCGVD